MMQDDFNRIPENAIDKSTITKWRRDIVKFPPVIKINNKGNNKLGHSAPFPKDIPEMAIKYFSYAGDIVLDPFAGSFTSVIEAKKLGRIGLGIEINKKSFRSVILNRINDNFNDQSVSELDLEFNL